MKVLSLVLAALALCAGAAGAQIQAQAVRWQLITRRKQESGKPVDVSELALSSGALRGRLVARVKLFDDGPDAEGILLRYALDGKIAPAGDAQFQPLQAIPFSIDEKRVPRMAGKKFLEVPVDVTAAVALQLKRLSMEGFVLRELRLQLMVAPRRGDRAIQSVETSLPVTQ